MRARSTRTTTQHSISFCAIRATLCNSTLLTVAIYLLGTCKMLQQRQQRQQQPADDIRSCEVANMSVVRRAHVLDENIGVQCSLAPQHAGDRLTRYSSHITSAPVEPTARYNNSFAANCSADFPRYYYYYCYHYCDFPLAVCAAMCGECPPAQPPLPQPPVSGECAVLQRTNNQQYARVYNSPGWFSRAAAARVLTSGNSRFPYLRTIALLRMRRINCAEFYVCPCICKSLRNTRAQSQPTPTYTHSHDNARARFEYKDVGCGGRRCKYDRICVLVSESEMFAAVGLDHFCIRNALLRLCASGVVDETIHRCSGSADDEEGGNGGVTQRQ